jgi:hypothetical protein
VLPEIYKFLELNTLKNYWRIDKKEIKFILITINLEKIFPKWRNFAPSGHDNWQQRILYTLAFNNALMYAWLIVLVEPHSNTVLPAGIFSYQNLYYGYFWEGLGMENVGMLDVHF